MQPRLFDAAPQPILPKIASPNAHPTAAQQPPPYMMDDPHAPRQVHYPHHAPHHAPHASPPQRAHEPHRRSEPPHQPRPGPRDADPHRHAYPHPPRPHADARDASKPRGPPSPWRPPRGPAGAQDAQRPSADNGRRQPQHQQHQHQQHQQRWPNQQHQQQHQQHQQHQHHHHQQHHQQHQNQQHQHHQQHHQQHQNQQNQHHSNPRLSNPRLSPTDQVVHALRGGNVDAAMAAIAKVKSLEGFAPNAMLVDIVSLAAQQGTTQLVRVLAWREGGVGLGNPDRPTYESCSDPDASPGRSLGQRVELDWKAHARLFDSLAELANLRPVALRLLANCALSSDDPSDDIQILPKTDLGLDADLLEPLPDRVVDPDEVMLDEEAAEGRATKLLFKSSVGAESLRGWYALQPGDASRCYKSQGENPWFCFFAEFSPSRRGWWIAASANSPTSVAAHCPCDDASPPRKGWHVADVVDGPRFDCDGGFLTSEPTLPGALRWKPGVLNAVRALKPRQLRGIVKGAAPNFFGHHASKLMMSYAAKLIQARQCLIECEAEDGRWRRVDGSGAVCGEHVECSFLAQAGSAAEPVEAGFAAEPVEAAAADSVVAAAGAASSRAADALNDAPRVGDAFLFVKAPEGLLAAAAGSLLAAPQGTIVRLLGRRAVVRFSNGAFSQDDASCYSLRRVPNRSAFETKRAAFAALVAQGPASPRLRALALRDDSAVGQGAAESADKIAADRIAADKKSGKCLLLADMNGTMLIRASAPIAGRVADVVHAGRHYYVREHARDLVAFAQEHFVFAFLTSMKLRNAQAGADVIEAALSAPAAGETQQPQQPQGPPWQQPQVPPQGQPQGPLPQGPPQQQQAQQQGSSQQGPQQHSTQQPPRRRIPVFAAEFNKPDDDQELRRHAWDTVRDLDRVWDYGVSRGFDATNTLMIDDTVRKMRQWPRNVYVVPEYSETLAQAGGDDALLRARKFLEDRVLGPRKRGELEDVRDALGPPVSAADVFAAMDTVQLAQGDDSGAGEDTGWIKAVDLSEALSEAQKGIVEKSRSQAVVLVQGGPGTGKSTLLMHIARQWCGQKMRVVALTGLHEMDGFCRGLSDQGLRVLQAGPRSKNQEAVWLEDQVEAGLAAWSDAAEARAASADASRGRELFRELALMDVAELQKRRANLLAARLKAKEDAADEQRPAAAASTAAAAAEAEASERRVLGCWSACLPLLNGLWVETVSRSFGKAVFEKDGDERLEVFYAEFGKKRKGWWVGSARRLRATRAFCHSNADASLPPETGWAATHGGGDGGPDTADAVKGEDKAQHAPGCFFEACSGDEVPAAIRAQIDGIERGAFLRALALESSKNAPTREVVRNAVLDDADVVVVSDAASHMDLRTLGPAKGILVDSSAENAAVSALAFIGCIKIVIASDLVIARDLGPENLVRRWARLGVAVETLETQFRQHALLMAFPNEHFFHNAIQNGPQNGPQDRPPVPLDGFVWPRSALPVAFVEIAPRWTAEGRDSPKRPAHNHGDDLHEREACKVVELLSGAVEARRLNAKGAQSIGVAAATPRQLASIQALWRERRRRGGARPGDALECDDVVEFGLVDDLRGREKDLVIFSSTPAGAHASDDAQRLCVLLTRARRGLVIVGARQVLRLQAHWQQFLEWCEQRELVIDSEEWSSKLASAERGATPEMRQRLAALAQAAPHGAPVQNALGVDAADAEALRRAVHALDGEAQPAPRRRPSADESDRPAKKSRPTE